MGILKRVGGIGCDSFNEDTDIGKRKVDETRGYEWRMQTEKKKSKREKL